MSGPSVGPVTARHPITGEERVTEREGTVLRSQAVRVANQHGWQADDGARDELTNTHEVWFHKPDGLTPQIVAKFDRKGRCQYTTACEPSRLLLLLSGSCSCEGFPRVTPFEGWQELVTDSECEVHRA